MKHLLKRASLSAVLALIAISAQGAKWQGVDQLDLLDERHAILLVRADNGPLHLESRPLP